VFLDLFPPKKFCFYPLRKALNILDAGLAVDGEKIISFLVLEQNNSFHFCFCTGPLKRQLGALEARDARAGAELAALQSRKEQLALEVSDAKQKQAVLGDVMTLAEQLSETLSKVCSFVVLSFLVVAEFVS
jgi:uncharacterized alpha-E superfamily protein